MLLSTKIKLHDFVSVCTAWQSMKNRCFFCLDHHTVHCLKAFYQENKVSKLGNQYMKAKQIKFGLMHKRLHLICSFGSINIEF